MTLIEFLKQNNAPAELIAQVESLKTVNIDSVKEFLEKDDAGKKYLQSHTDAVVTKAIATYKEKTVPGLVEEEIKKKFPAETEEQKRLRQLEDDNKKFQAEVKRERLLNKAIAIANEKKLPLKLVDKFLGDDEETTAKNLELLEQEYSNALKLAVETKFKENGRDPGGNGNPPADYSKMTDEQYFQSRLSEQKK